MWGVRAKLRMILCFVGLATNWVNDRTLGSDSGGLGRPGTHIFKKV